MIKDGLKMILPTGKFGWWARYVKFVTYAINTSYCKSIGMTPFEAYYARKPNNHPSTGNLKFHPKYTPRTEDWLQPMRDNIKDTSCDMKNKYLEEANKHNKKEENSLQVGLLIVIAQHNFQSRFLEEAVPI